jgi:GxxExxY protein
MNREQTNYYTGQVLDSCLEVHKQFGPGLLESVYEYGLITEFSMRNIKADFHVAVPLFYKGHETGKVFQLDVLVENEIILELKSVDIIHPVYEAQLITYLRLANKKVGFLINFNVPLLKNGFKRYVNNF